MKNQFNWKIITAFTSFALLSLGLVFFKEKPVKIEEYHGVKIGDKADDLIYKKGVPSEVLGPETYDKEFGYSREVKKIESNNLGVEKEVLKFEGWYIEITDNYSLAVYFNRPGGEVSSIVCTSRGGREGCQSVNGVTIGTTEEDLTKKLGVADKENLEGRIKTAQYENLRLKFMLEKEKVYSIIVF